MTDKQTFSEVFSERIKGLEVEAKSAGMSFTEVCRLAGMSRATPDRWKREIPKTIELVDRMAEIIDAKKVQQAA